MHFHLTTVEQVCTPGQLATGLGADIKVKGERRIMPCPTCKGDLDILESGFLCSGPSCGFRAGGVLDLLEQGKGYQHAIRRLAQLFPDRFKEMALSGEAENLDSAAAQAKARRRLYNFFLRAGAQGAVERMSVQGTNSLRRLPGVDLTASPFCAFPLSAASRSELVSILEEIGADGQLHGSAPIVIPYFTDHHTVGILVHLANIKTAPRYIRILPKKFQFAGLMQQKPGCRGHTLMASYALMLSKNSEFARTDPGKLALHSLYDPKAEGLGWLPERASYVEAQNNRWAPLVMLARESNIYVAGQPLPDHLVGVTEKLITADGLGPAARDLLDQLQLFDGAAEALMTRLRAGRHLELLQAVRKRLATRTLDVGAGGASLVAKDDGYFYSKDGLERRLSTFTLNVQEAVRFAGSRDVFYKCGMNFAGKVTPILLPADALDTPRRLRQEVQATQVTADSMPVLSEVSGQGASMLMRYLASRPAHVNVTEGISHLGWNHARNTFYGPSWITDEKGTNHYEATHHPGENVLTHFEGKPRPTGKIGELGLDASDLIAQAVAMVFRAYHGVPAIAVPVARSAEAELMLKSLFGALGQILPFAYSDAQWKRGVGVGGFPVWGTGATAWQVGQVKQPVFMLCERGVRITEATAERDGSIFRRALTDAVEWMITARGTEFEPARSVDPAHVLGKEGAAVLRKVTGSEWPVKNSTYAALDAALGALPFSATQQYVRFDINRRAIELRLEGLPADAQEVAADLGRLANGVKVTDTGVEANDADMASLLETFYQDKPAMEEIFQPPSP